MTVQAEALTSEKYTAPPAQPVLRRSERLPKDVSGIFYSTRDAKRVGVDPRFHIPHAESVQLGSNFYAAVQPANINRAYDLAKNIRGAYGRTSNEISTSTLDVTPETKLNRCLASITEEPETDAYFAQFTKHFGNQYKAHVATTGNARVIPLRQVQTINHLSEFRTFEGEKSDDGKITVFDINKDDVLLCTTGNYLEGISDLEISVILQEGGKIHEIVEKIENLANHRNINTDRKGSIRIIKPQAPEIKPKTYQYTPEMPLKPGTEEKVKAEGLVVLRDLVGIVQETYKGVKDLNKIILNKIRVFTQIANTNQRTGSIEIDAARQYLEGNNGSNFYKLKHYLKHLFEETRDGINLQLFDHAESIDDLKYMLAFIGGIDLSYKLGKHRNEDNIEDYYYTAENFERDVDALSQAKDKDEEKELLKRFPARCGFGARAVSILLKEKKTQ